MIERGAGKKKERQGGKLNPVALQEVRMFQNPISYPETPDVWMPRAGIFRSQIGRFLGLGLVKILTLLCAA